MQPNLVVVELEAAILQASLTIGLAVLFGLLHRRYQRPHFLWWSWAWLLYTVRVGLIGVFLVLGNQGWLYLHQVVTGWTAIAVLGAALSFERRYYLRPVYGAAALIPVVWSYLTIFVLDDFVLAASLTVVLMSAATAWTGLVFLRFRRRTGSVSAAFVAGTLFLWAAHHLDYPLLRARGLLAPWSYYIDSVLILAVGVGVLLLVMEELQRGLRTLSDLSGDLHRATAPDGGPAMLLERALGLAGVSGSALWTSEPAPTGAFTHPMGTCSGWTEAVPVGALHAALRRAVRTGRPLLIPDGEVRVNGAIGRTGFAGVLPVLRDGDVNAAAVIAGPARAPFTALDDDFLLALGQQIGAALERAALDRRLEVRSAELERLSLRLVQQHEDQRRRLARELHDETAQVFSAMKLRLGLLAEAADATARQQLEHLSRLVDTGMDSIRNVAEDLRPPVLDDLGLGAALQALTTDFRSRTGIATTFESIGTLPHQTDDVELALFRALQEALANVARHAQARSVRVALTGNGAIVLTVEDDGAGFDRSAEEHTRRMGLVGMQERLAAVGGRLAVRSGAGRGTLVEVEVPGGGDLA